MFPLKKLRLRAREVSEDYVDAMDTLDFGDEDLSEDDGLQELPTPADELATAMADLAPSAWPDRGATENGDHPEAEPEEMEALSPEDRSNAMAHALKAFDSENSVDVAVQVLADRVPVVEIVDLRNMTQEVVQLLSEGAD